MRGHNVNIYFSEKNYQKIKPLIEKRKVSEFVNRIVEKELEKKEQQSKEELRKKIIEGYKRSVKNRSPEEREALRAMGEASLEDVFTELNKRENEQK